MTRMETLNIIFSTKNKCIFIQNIFFYRQEKKMRCFIGFIERFIYFYFLEKKNKKIRKNSAGDIPNTCEEVLMVIKKKDHQIVQDGKIAIRN